MKQIILTGDRPTGNLHVGHYVGSLAERVKLQNSGKYDEIYIMIADAQALTDNAEHPERPAYSLEVEPGSLTEYLLGKIQAEARRSDEAIEEALDALDTARDCVRSLQK